MTRSHIGRRYGWLPDVPDHRDHVRVAPMLQRLFLPSKVDLRDTGFFSDCYDQGDLGSCTGNAIAAAVQFARAKAGQLPGFIPSRLFIYFCERFIEEAIAQDAGAQIRDGFRSINKWGVGPEQSDPAAASDWPYDVTKFAVTPPQSVYDAAEHHQAIRYARVPRVLTQMKACLAGGFPFVFGFSVYSSFETQDVASSGIVPMPDKSETLLGGHAVVAVGYDDATQRFIVRNSWGTAWGQHGYFTMPYAYLTDADLADDFWAVQLLEA